MKDAFGGSFILRIMLVFFAFFIIFMVFAINFAKTYRVKNGVMDIVERSYGSTATEIQVEIEDYLKSINYGPSQSHEQREMIKNNYCKATSSSEYFSYNDSGICISPVIEGKNIYHYKVTSYMVVSFAFLKFGVPIPISGETKTFNDYFD